jgi:pilus assembly protein Flp/PilA
MLTLYWKIRFKLQSLTMREEGQDLVEYALVISLIAIAAVASLTALARHITGVFSTIDTSL